MGNHQFRPYSLRRGGATFWFGRHQSLDRLLIQGRWASQKTARIYLNEGLAMLASMHLPKSHPNLRPFLNIYTQTARNLNFSTLEPPVPGRSGGLGKKRRQRARKSRKRPFCLAVRSVYSFEFFITGRNLPLKRSVTHSRRSGSACAGEIEEFFGSNARGLARLGHH